MSRHNEHGPVVDVDREHGPEWWTVGAQLCTTCGHRVDIHNIGLVDETPYPCEHEGCDCADLTLDSH